MKIAIVGGGISGLSTAYFLRQSLRQRTTQTFLLESSSRWGGIIQTEHLDGFVLEAGPDSFLSQKPQALDLIRKLGLEGRLIRSRSAHQQVYLFLKRKLQPFPGGLFLAPPLSQFHILRSPLLSWKGKLRAALEPFISTSGLEDESVANFFHRRLGQEVLRKIAEPLMTGVYGGDAYQLSLQSCFPLLYARERTGKSITCVSNRRASRKEHPPMTTKTEGLFVSLKRGMGELIETLVMSLDSTSLHLGTTVTKVHSKRSGFQIELNRKRALEVDVLILATPAYVSSAILSESFPEIATALETIPYTSSIILCLGYQRELFSGQLGSGFLIPRSENKTLSACTWVCNKFSHRCPEGSSLLRCFVGGPSNQPAMDWDDEKIRVTLRAELDEILKVHQQPAWEKIYRWRKSLPQYTIGHQRRVETLNEKLNRTPGLYCIGNYLDGIGIPDCIRHAEKVAGKVSQLVTR